ncbi:MAG: hypothetical protein JRE45_15570 [Deltaproteobacteria bacterium]|nr:hypothetical protein [Deltaproteobacteria bacterium]
MSNQTRGTKNETEFAAREQSRVFRELERALPVDDLMGWLIRALPLANRDQLFSVLKAIYEAGFEIGPASQTPRLYELGRDTFQACPQRVTARRAG